MPQLSEAWPAMQIHIAWGSQSRQFHLWDAGLATDIEAYTIL